MNFDPSAFFMDPSYLTAAGAGVLSFLSPCILPMVPFYLSYMAGISMQELTGESKIAPGARLRLFISSILFAAGVITIFVMLGMFAAGFGHKLGQYKDIMEYAAALILLIFGLHFLGIMRIPFLYREAKIDSSSVKPASYLGSYLIGLAFGFGWTPCAGPFLAMIITIAAMQDTIWQGGGLLFVYGAAMTFPFVAVALFSGPFLRFINRHRSWMGHIEKIMGVFLILFAILIATGSMSLLSQWMIETFPGIAKLGK